jgi:hypothetical protein
MALEVMFLENIVLNPLFHNSCKEEGHDLWILETINTSIFEIGRNPLWFLKLKSNLFEFWLKIYQTL